MLSKKQYWVTLTGGLLGFCILFAMVYLLTYMKQEKPEPVSFVAAEDVVDVIEAIEEPPIIIETVIEPHTFIEVRLIDEEGEILTTGTIHSQSLLGLSREEIEARFPTYEIEQFSSEKVLLIKRQQALIKERYFLGIQEEWIGIVVVGETESFISLPLQAKLFSKNTNRLLQAKEIEITKAQKEQLMENPYYIEQILENYTQ
jgi:hypothetical protein